VIYGLQPKSIKPIIVITLPYAGKRFEDIAHHLASAETLVEPKGIMEASWSHQKLKLAGFLEVSACLGIFSVQASLHEENQFSRGSSITCDAKYFDGANLAAIAVATVGNSAEEECSKLYRRGEYIDAIVLDAMASTALEDAITEIRMRVRNSIGSGRLGHNLFPGTKPMPVEVLKTVFSLLRPERTVFVNLMESMIMIPIKSISVIIPAGPELVARCDDD